MYEDVKFFIVKMFVQMIYIEFERKRQSLHSQRKLLIYKNKLRFFAVSFTLTLSYQIRFFLLMVIYHTNEIFLVDFPKHLLLLH